MKALAIWLATALSLCGTAAWPQDMAVEQIAHMLVQDLSPTGAMEGGQWFTNESVTGRATRALAVIYVHVPGSAGTVSIHVALYDVHDSGWVKVRDVQGLFGMGPTDAVFHPDRVELSTLMLGPEDPRCCPTLVARWSVNLASGVATRLQ